jgi:DegV family protein with EDD domain
MRIVINQGANLPPRAIEHYEIVMAPAHIVAGKKEHDTRDGISHETLDFLVKNTPEFPYVVGTTAQEFTHVFTEIAHADSEIVVVAASRKLIQTYSAALAASRTVTERAAYSSLKIAVVDSRQVDVGAGMLALAAGEARLAGVPLRTTVAMLETMAARVRFVGTVATLDNLVRGGRAGFLRSWVANFLNVKPILAIEDGDLKSTGNIRANVDPLEAIADELAKIGGGRRVWVGIAHGSAPERAVTLLKKIQKRFNVAYALIMPLNPSVYLHMGRGSIFAAVFPIDNLAWEPTTPPDFSVG